jgi:hypothetical protein
MLGPRFILPVSIALLASSAACSDASSSGSGGDASGGSGSQKSSSSGGFTTSTTGQGGAFGTSSTTGAGGAHGSSLVYASTDTTLFTLDPKDPMLPLVQVGDFDCVDPVNGPHKAMVDVAVDMDEHLFGITGHDVMPLTIQGNTVHCGTTITLNSGGASTPTFYALTFAPAGVIDPQKEVLVAGNSAGELWAIDDAGNATKHGIFGTVPADDGHGHTYAAANVGKAWELSGDLVFLANGGSPVGFATVRDCPNPPSTTGCSYVDTLIEIDMTKLASPGNQAVIMAVRGQLVKKSGCNDGIVGDYGSMYGIAAWNDKVYGFSRTGNLVSVDTTDGGTCNVKNYSPNKFSGAGVTTLAPVVPPPPPN